MIKEYKVYEIRNSLGLVEYVGRTQQPLKSRLRGHRYEKPNKGRGLFYFRDDVSIHLIRSFNNKAESIKFEGELKKIHGFEWTEVTTCKAIGAKYGSQQAKNNFRKLTLKQANEIRELYKVGDTTYAKLGAIYGVHGKNIGKIVRGLSYVD